MKSKLFDSLRVAVSSPTTSVQLCLIGVLGGLVAACVIILFRLLLNFLQISILGEVGTYQSLSATERLILPIAAVCLILLLAKITKFKRFRLGIPYVIHRFKMHYGHIPFVTTINQFFGGIFALASGFVVGKEGPTVHLAAATSHYVGRWCKLPFNSLRIFSGCGIAAGIAAAFNTPYAAVIFVMEVVMRQYKVHIFIPVMLAAACGSVLTRLVFGDYTGLNFLDFQAIPTWQLPLLVLFGICLGALAALFNKQLMLTMKLFRSYSMVFRLFLAGAITGACAYFMPVALGTEFANINVFLNSEPTLAFVTVLFVLKFMLANTAIALGVPGGIIGAVMVIGVTAGALFVHLIQYYFGLHGHLESFALLGLAGLLAAVLSAPMAALSAAMELSMTQQVILPAIITIVSAYVTSKQLFRNRSVFIQQLEYQGLSYTTTAIRNELQATGVLAIVQTNCRVLENADQQALLETSEKHPNDFVIQKENLDEYSQSYYLAGAKRKPHSDAVQLTMQKLESLSEQHTLAEVYEMLYLQRSGAVLIWSNNMQSIKGIVTWKALHNYLLRQQH